MFKLQTYLISLYFIIFYFQRYLAL